jgi:hypothetical protein
VSGAREWEARVRQLEAKLGAAEVIEHAGVERRCPGYGRRVVPTVDLGGVMVGRQRVGLGC